ncbi:hypothetical protein DDI_3644 [Dickeya dianthicola RNS04.9]|nr:hypothetical protein DDI_3644 [Dickeya dianthicola RNS04.9]
MRSQPSGLAFFMLLWRYRVITTLPHMTGQYDIVGLFQHCRRHPLNA